MSYLKFIQTLKAFQTRYCGTIWWLYGVTSKDIDKMKQFLKPFYDKLIEFSMHSIDFSFSTFRKENLKV